MALERLAIYSISYNYFLVYMFYFEHYLQLGFRINFHVCLRIYFN